MGEHILRIGWYCPYSLYILRKIDRVTPIRISWKESCNGRLGETKLCKKLTALINFSFKEGQLDGLVLQSCCNLAHYIGDYLREEELFPIYRMDLPLQKGEQFKSSLLYHWKRIDKWLEGIEGGLKSTSPLPSREKTAYDEPFWCGLPLELTIDGLLKGVKCPHRFESTDNIPDYDKDKECLAQSYFHTMKSWGEVRQVNDE